MTVSPDPAQRRQPSSVEEVAAIRQQIAARHPVIADECQVADLLMENLASRGDLYPHEVVEWLLDLPWRHVLEVTSRAAVAAVNPCTTDNHSPRFANFCSVCFAYRVRDLYWAAHHLGDGVP